MSDGVVQILLSKDPEARFCPVLSNRQQNTSPTWPDSSIIGARSADVRFTPWIIACDGRFVVLPIVSADEGCVSLDCLCRFMTLEEDSPAVGGSFLLSDISRAITTTVEGRRAACYQLGRSFENSGAQDGWVRVRSGRGGWD